MISYNSYCPHCITNVSISVDNPVETELVVRCKPCNKQFYFYKCTLCKEHKSSSHARLTCLGCVNELFETRYNQSLAIKDLHMLDFMYTAKTDLERKFDDTNRKLDLINERLDTLTEMVKFLPPVQGPEYVSTKSDFSCRKQTL